MSHFKPCTQAAKLVAARVESLAVPQARIYERLRQRQGWWWVRMNTPKPFPFSCVSDLARALLWSVNGPEARALEAAIAADHGKRNVFAAPYVNNLEAENEQLRARLAKLEAASL